MTDNTTTPAPSEPVAGPVQRKLGQAAEARWYCLDRDGVAMLCKDEEDARAQAVENDACWPGRAPHRAALLGDVSENYSADAERFRWLAEHTVATGLARWVHPFQFLGEAVDARRKLNRPPTPVGWSDTDWIAHLEKVQQNEVAYARGPLPERGWD